MDIQCWTWESWNRKCDLEWGWIVTFAFDTWMKYWNLTSTFSEAAGDGESFPHSPRRGDRRQCVEHVHFLCMQWPHTLIKHDLVISILWPVGLTMFTWQKRPEILLITFPEWRENGCKSPPLSGKVWMWGKEERGTCPNINGNENNSSNRGYTLLIVHYDPGIVLSFLPILLFDLHNNPYCLRHVTPIIQVMKLRHRQVKPFA